MNSAKTLYKCAKISREKSYKLNIATTEFTVHEVEICKAKNDLAICKICLFINSEITPGFVVAINKILNTLPLINARDFNGSIEIEYYI